MRKVCCPSCYRVTEIEEDLETYKCPKCEKEVSVTQASRLMELLTQRYANDGFKYLYETHEYEKAVDSYQKYLLVEEDNEDVVLYLVIAYIKASKVRENHFNDIFNLLDKNETLLSNFSNEDLKILDMIIETLDLVDDYLARLKKILSKDNEFYDEDAKAVYTLALSNVIKLVDRYTQYFYADCPLDDETELPKKAYLERIDRYRKAQKEELKVMEHSDLHLNGEENLLPNEIFRSGDKFQGLRKINTIALFFGVLIILVGVILIFAIRDNYLIGIIVAIPGVLIALVCSIIKAVLNKKSSD